MATAEIDPQVTYANLLDEVKEAAASVDWSDNTQHDRFERLHAALRAAIDADVAIGLIRHAMDVGAESA